MTNRVFVRDDEFLDPAPGTLVALPVGSGMSSSPSAAQPLIMSILDLFRSKWSAGAMTEDDRRRLFWYLKRKTSYTAWKREADRYARFVALVEKQVKEQPVVKDRHGDPVKWGQIYTEVLKGAIHYEKGLNQLRQGDRSTFLYKDGGELRDAMSVSAEWHSEIVNGGREFEPDKYPGKYVRDMQVTLQWFFEAARDTGYLQPRMANRSAFEVWYPERHQDLLALPIPTPLPDVPPYTKASVRTGEPTPVFGIYEPQIRDGCMNYLLQGEPSRSYSSLPVDYSGRPVTWRLVWEDRRYEDGSIPEEEHDYFSNDSVDPAI